MNKVVLPPRYKVLWILLLLPYLVTILLCFYAVFLGFERWLILSAAFLATGCRISLRHLFSLYKVRYTWPGFQLGKSAGRWNIALLLVLMFAGLWFAAWLLRSNQLPPHGLGIYSPASLAVVLNIAFGSIWILTMVETVLLFYFTYSEKYRSYWFDYFMSTGQLTSGPEVKDKQP